MQIQFQSFIHVGLCLCVFLCKWHGCWNSVGLGGSIKATHRYLIKWDYLVTQGALIFIKRINVPDETSSLSLSWLEFSIMNLAITHQLDCSFSFAITHNINVKFPCVTLTIQFFKSTTSLDRHHKALVWKHSDKDHPSPLKHVNGWSIAIETFSNGLTWFKGAQVE